MLLLFVIAQRVLGLKAHLAAFAAERRGGLMRRGNVALEGTLPAESLLTEIARIIKHTRMQFRVLFQLSFGFELATTLGAQMVTCVAMTIFHVPLERVARREIFAALFALIISLDAMPCNDMRA